MLNYPCGRIFLLGLLNFQFNNSHVESMYLDLKSSYKDDLFYFKTWLVLLYYDVINTEFECETRAFRLSFFFRPQVLF